MLFSRMNGAVAPIFILKSGSYKILRAVL